MTTPWRRVVFSSYTYSSSDEQSSESSEYPHRAPPQSSLTRPPARVMPKRSHVQQLLPELTLLGELELVEREVRDGTSEPESESYSESEESSTDCWAKRRLSSSSVVLSYWVLMTWRVWPGRCGVGATMRAGLRERPFATDAVETRRDLRSEALEVLVDDDLAAGMSMMLSLRPVVGSVVWSLAGSCETW